MDNQNNNTSQQLTSHSLQKRMEANNTDGEIQALKGLNKALLYPMWITTFGIGALTAGVYKYGLREFDKIHAIEDEEKLNGENNSHMFNKLFAGLMVLIGAVCSAAFFTPLITGHLSYRTEHRIDKRKSEHTAIRDDIIKTIAELEKDPEGAKKLDSVAGELQHFKEKKTHYASNAGIFTLNLMAGFLSVFFWPVGLAPVMGTRGLASARTKSERAELKEIKNVLAGLNVSINTDNAAVQAPVIPGEQKQNGAEVGVAK